MLRIRLRRMGSRNHPFYRVVVSDSRRVPTASAVEEVGYYDPSKNPAIVRIDHDRVEHWVSNGARMSKTVEKLLAAAPASEGGEERVQEESARTAEAAAAE